jgi:ubiquinone/menaquinone biosynthesis C-methylase UbiE
MMNLGSQTVLQDEAGPNLHRRQEGFTYTMPSNSGSGKTPAQVDDQAKLARGLNGCDFRRVASNGFGDPYNAYPHSMAWFQNHLYVGTTRACLAHRGRWRSEKQPDAMGEIWPVKLAKGPFDIDLRAEIWRYHPPTDKWEMAYKSPVVVGIDGYEVPRITALRAMTTFQGRSDSDPALYVLTSGSHQTPEAMTLRSSDGFQFEAVCEPGLGFPEPYKPRGLRALAELRGHLFTSPAVGRKRKDPNDAGFMIVGVNPDPAREKWRVACEPHFGDSNNLTVFELAEFNGHVYAGTLNVVEGFQIWKTDAAGSPPYKWKRVISHGAYRGRLNQAAMTMQAFGGHLYVGTGVQEGGFDRANNVGPAAIEIIRINPDDTWDLVVGGPRPTPDGLKVPLSGLGPGFGNICAGYLWSMSVHEGWIYVGTFDWLMGLMYSQRDRWPENLQKGLSHAKVKQLVSEFGGFDVWRSRDGRRWMPVTQNGFGNYFNYGARTMMSTPCGLFVGAANPFAPEVAIKRAAGWDYSDNPKGGLEIWRGASDRPGATSSLSVSAQPMSGISAFKACGPRPSLVTPCSSAMQVSRKSETRAGACRSGTHFVSLAANDNADKQIEEIIVEFYGGTDYRHLGYWGDGITDAKAACENLVDEILAFVPEKNGTIVDVNCGRGATTGCLRKHFPAGMITGITSNKMDLAACQSNAPGVAFRFMNAPKLRLGSESTNLIVWARGLDQPPTRRDLLFRCFQSLKPGGRLVCFDTLQPETRKSFMWKIPSACKKRIETLDDYREALVAVGFRQVRATDVTDDCLEGFRRHRARYFHRKRLSEEIEASMLQDVETRFIAAETSIRQCLIVHAYKPLENEN